MNRKKLFLLLGGLVLGWAANAQTTDNTATTDTTQHTMHHRFHGAPHDSTFHRFRRAAQDSTFHRFQGAPGAFGHDRRDNFAFHRPGQNRFQPGRRFHHHFIQYTPEQRQQVAAINKEYRQKSADLFKQDNLTLGQYKAGLLALEKEKKAKLQALLTPQQKAELAARRKRMDENRQVMAAARLERLRLELSLTDDQVAQIKAGQQNLRNQTEAIRDNDNLLPREKHQQIKALMIARNDSFKTILTSDQYSKFQQLRSRHHFGRPDNGPDGRPWHHRGMVS